MTAIFLLFLTGKSVIGEHNYQINLSDDSYLLHLSDDQITIYKENNKKKLLYSWNRADDRIFYPKINIISDSKNTNKIIVSSHAHNSLHINLNIENKDAKADFTNIYFDKNIKCSYDKIKIDFYSNTKIYFHNIPSDIFIKASKDNYLLEQIIPESNRNKIVICYEGNDCSKHQDFSIQNDQTYLSNINDKNFQDLFNNIISNSHLKYIRFLLVERGNDYELSFNQIPSEKVEQIQLYGYSENDQIPKIKLAENVETKRIKSWLVNNVKFSQEKDVKKPFYFNDFTVLKSNDFLPDLKHKNIEIKSSEITTLDDACHEIIPENKDKIELIIGQCIQFGDTSDVFDASCVLIDGSKIQGECTIIINRKQDNKYETLNLEIDGFDKGVVVQFECEGNEINKHFAYSITSKKEGQRILTDTGTCNDVDIKVIKPSEPENQPSSSEKVEPIESENDSSTSEKVEPIETNSDSENRPPIETSYESGKEEPIESENEPVHPTPSESSFPAPDAPIVNNYTYCSYTINLTSVGFVNDTTSVSIAMDRMNQVSFEQDNITVYENSGLNSPSPLYFTAMQRESKIIVDKDVNLSNIGVTTVNSPTVHLHKTVNPLSFYHDDINGGNVSIVVNNYDQKSEILVLNDVNDRKGNFTLLCVDNTIQTVSLSSIVMSNVSSFYVRYYKQSSTKSTFSEENDNEKIDVDVLVRNKIIINQNADSVLNNFNLSGILVIHDDSKLTIENDSILTKNSEIEFIISHNFESSIKEQKKPVISVLGDLHSELSKIVISSGESGVPINVVNFPLFQFNSNITNCTEFEDLFVFEEGRDGQIDAKCSIQNGENDNDENFVLLLTAVENIKERNTKKKLSAGAIAGIVIAAIFVVGLIIALAVYFCRKKNNDKNNEVARDVNKYRTVKKRKSRSDSEEDDSNSVGL